MAQNGGLTGPGPRFAVVIPLYNKRDTLGRALESVLANAAPDLDAVIVVDDGSTDGSGAVARAWADQLPLRLITQGNAGAAAARNRGFAEARASHVLCLDADDSWAPGHLAAHRGLIAAHPQAVLYATRYARLRGDLGGTDVDHPALHGMPEGGGLIADWFTAMARGEMPVTSSSACVPRAVFARLGGFPEGISHGEDRIFWSRCALAGPVAWSPELTAFYHLDADGRSYTSWTPARGSAYLRFLEGLEAADPRPAGLTAALATERFRHGMNAGSLGHPGTADAMAAALVASGHPAAAAKVTAFRAARGLRPDMALPPEGLDPATPPRNEGQGSDGGGS